MPGRDSKPGQINEDPGAEVATFAGGCFWELEDAFRQVPGVVSVVSGYTGGHAENPTYEQVCAGSTGHAEAVRVVFDPRRVTYAHLLRLFFRLHDPTQLDRQGVDIGSQYRSAVFYHNGCQQAEVEAVVADMNLSERYSGRVVTRIEPAGRFWPAEEYHQCYYTKLHGEEGCRDDA